MVVWRVSGSMTTWGCGVRGLDGGHLRLLNDYAAENDRGRLALVVSLPNNTYSAGKHLQ